MKPSKEHRKLRDQALALGNLGYLYLAIPAAAYAMYTKVPYIPSPYPGDGPNLTGLPAFGNHVEEAKQRWMKMKAKQV